MKTQVLRLLSWAPICLTNVNSVDSSCYRVNVNRKSNLIGSLASSLQYLYFKILDLFDRDMDYFLITGRGENLLLLLDIFPAH